jgi:hypothetical protein
MWREWLGDTTIEHFRSHYLGREPFATPSTVSNHRVLLDWELLSAVLVADTAPDVLVVAKGQLLPFPAPRSIDELRGYFRMGVGLCVRHTERCHPSFRRIADAFADLGDAQVQLFVTPGGTHGFGWHYDDEDVFIAQTAGIKDYYFRANTVVAEQRADASLFRDISKESSTLCTATLVPGDFLYLPARWWHMAVCQQTSLSISVGVTTRRSVGTAMRGE